MPAQAATLEEQTIRFLKQEQLPLPDPETHLLLAVSGGVDSTAMTYLLWQLGFSIGIAHCNFQLRGASSDADQQLVSQMADRLDAPLHTRHFETRTYAREHGVSLEMAARELRYAWFNELRQQHAYSYLTTAHHLNDQVETLLLNLTKGTGLKGMTAIQPLNGYTLRPLLFATKQQLIQYATHHGLSWREDETNLHGTHDRNHIRHQVIPALQALNPSLEHTIYANIQHFRGIYTVWEQEQQEQWRQLARKQGNCWFISRPELEVLEPLSPYLFAFLSPFGLNKDQLTRLQQALSHQPGALFYSDAYQVEVARDSLLVAPYPLQAEQQSIPGPDGTYQVNGFRFTLTLTEPQHLDLRAPAYAYLDADKLTFPLLLRPWQAGDRFYPLGMEHPKKLSDFFVDEHWPRLLKAQTLILQTRQGAIAWVVGSRLDERFKVTPGTKQVLAIHFEGANQV